MRPAAGAIGFLVGVLSFATTPAPAQSATGRSPNVRPQWTLGAGAAALRIGHRFEFLAGGDELLNIPTLSLGIGLGRGLATGIDFTSNSEIDPGALGGNESQLWVAITALRTARIGVDATAAYNTLAGSLDGAVTATAQLRGVSLIAEARGFQHARGGTAAAGAASVGAILHLTPRLEISADVGQALTPERRQSTWSAAVGIVIPGSPHTLALQASNAGATTLQGATQRQVIGNGSVRYGFVFSIPLGSARQWARIFRRGGDEAPPVPPGASATVRLHQVAVVPREVTIRAGESVAWLNHDPLVHTVVSDAGHWDSGDILPGTSFLLRFDRPGRYPYHCRPHPQMRGVIVVE